MYKYMHKNYTHNILLWGTIAFRIGPAWSGSQVDSETSTKWSEFEAHYSIIFRLTQTLTKLSINYSHLFYSKLSVIV